MIDKQGMSSTPASAPPPTDRCPAVPPAPPMLPVLPVLPVPPLVPMELVRRSRQRQHRHDQTAIDALVLQALQAHLPQQAIFTDDRLRNWTGLRPAEIRQALVRISQHGCIAVSGRVALRAWRYRSQWRWVGLDSQSTHTEWA